MKKIFLNTQSRLIFRCPDILDKNKNLTAMYCVMCSILPGFCFFFDIVFARVKFPTVNSLHSHELTTDTYL